MKFTTFAAVFSLFTLGFAAPAGDATGVGALVPTVANALSGNNLGSTDLGKRQGDIIVPVDADVPVNVNVKRGVATIDSVFAPIEAKVAVIVAKLKVDAIAVADVKILIPELLAVFVELEAHIRLLVGAKVDLQVLALRIEALLAVVLDALVFVSVHLAANISVIAPLIIQVGVAIQAFIGVCVDLFIGLDVKLAVVLRVLVDLFVKLNLHLKVGALVV